MCTSHCSRASAKIQCLLWFSHPLSERIVRARHFWFYGALVTMRASAVPLHYSKTAHMAVIGFSIDVTAVSALEKSRISHPRCALVWGGRSGYLEPALTGQAGLVISRVRLKRAPWRSMIRHQNTYRSLVRTQLQQSPYSQLLLGVCIIKNRHQKIQKIQHTEIYSVNF